MKKDLMQMLIDDGYPKKDIFNHRSDLYIYCTAQTAAIIDRWAKINGYKKPLFVSIFTDQITGRKMYDVAFQYTPFWEGDRQ